MDLMRCSGKLRRFILFNKNSGNCFDMEEHMEFWTDLCLAAVFIRIAWTDIRTMTIPDRELVLLVILVVLSLFTEPEISLSARIIGIFSAALPMYIADLFVDNAFGGGDIRLLAVMGFYLGWKRCLVGTCTGLFIGGLQSAVLLTLGKVKLGEQTGIPFAPALCAGLFAAKLWSDQIIALFLGRSF